MTTTTTWYRVEPTYSDKCPWKIIPIPVVKQTAKMLLTLESWESDGGGRKAGTRERRELMDGSQFDNLEAANAAIRDRLVMARDKAQASLECACKNLNDWKDVTR